MRKKKGLLFLAFLLAGNLLLAQPEGYYDTAEGLSGEALRQALHELIDDHTSCTYTELWTWFQQTDAKTDGTVWDIYSDNPDGEEPYTYVFITDQCGNYTAEGECYNREHSFPKSWFGGEILPMYTDLFQIYPTDGYVNNKRGNLPYGETGSPSWTSMNGSRLGPCSVAGYTGEVFEPLDEYKGDLARSYFYMAVRYYGEDNSWPGSDMTDGAEPLDWALEMLMDWSSNDPVSEKESLRNESIYNIQGNRNPFIDHPEYVDALWGDPDRISLPETYAGGLLLWPNPAGSTLTVRLTDAAGGEARVLKIYTLTGILLKTESMGLHTEYQTDVSFLAPGVYMVVAETATNRFRQRLIIY